MARRWRQVSLQEAQQHPLYGVKNWLAVFAFGLVFGPLREIGEFARLAHEGGGSFFKFFSADPTGRGFIKGAFLLEVTLSVSILMMMAQKDRDFRTYSIALLLGYFPVLVGWAYWTGGLSYSQFSGPLARAVVAQLPVALIWVAYLQRSCRVRVTFENCVLELAKGNQAETSGSPSPEKETGSSDEHWARALDELRQGSYDQATWARAYAHSDGQDNKAQAIYLKLRVEQFSTGTETLQRESDSASPLQDEPEYLSRAYQRIDQIHRGELKTMAGTVTLQPIAAGLPWGSRDVIALEESQCWWSSSDDGFWIYLHNTSSFNLSTIALDYASPLPEAVPSRAQFCLAFERVLAPEEYVAVNFNPGFVLTPCAQAHTLIVSGAWS